LETVSLKKRILLPLTLALCVLVGVFIFNVYWTYQSKIADDVHRHLISVNELFKKRLNSEIKLMDAAINMLSRSQEMQYAWMTGNRDILQAVASPFMMRLRTMFHTTHFYFHDIERRNFLRVHKPEKYGDIIDRYTALEAEKSGQPVAGVELGPLGTFTLRSVHPWWIDDEIAGYIEMGEEIDHVINDLHNVIGAELYVAIHKDFLVRGEWESGMRMLGRQPKWDQFSSTVIVSQTLKKTPPIIGDFLSIEHHEPLEMVSELKFSLEGRLYRGGFVPLYDVRGIENGEIVTLFDVTEQVTNAHNAILLISLISVVVGSVLFVSFYTILGRVERQLENSHLNLIEARNNLETKVEKRTAELVKANRELQALSAHLQSIREEERTHVAREIHDELGQLLTATKIELGNLSAELPQDKNLLIEKTESIAKIIDTGIQTVKKISSNLRPGILDVLGVVPAIENHAEKFQTLTGIACEVITDTDEIALDKNSSIAIFRIFQEALTNVTRHANATRVKIDLKKENNLLILEISDNGMGIAKEKLASSESFGLIGMKERAQSIGGKVIIDSVEDKGTTITLTIPLPQMEKSQDDKNSHR
jgi:signal transduction histidine kinase